MAYVNTVHQNRSVTHPTLDIPDCPHTGLASDWLLALSSAIPVSSYCPASCSSASLSSGEVEAPPFARACVLCWGSPYCWWSHWTLDLLVFGWPQSVDLRRILDSRGQEQVDPTRAPDLLGASHQYQRGWMDAPARTRPTISPMGSPWEHAHHAEH